MFVIDGLPPGRACRDRGGIFDPLTKCASPRPGYVDFARYNGHYVSPLVINHEDGRVEQVPLTDIRARTYRGIVPVDAAIEWIARQPSDKPWMATVSFASAHTPVMQPPPALLASGATATSGLDCGNANQQRILHQPDDRGARHRGRPAARRPSARRIAPPTAASPTTAARANTMVVIIGDNGTLGSAVKFPFDPQRAKGTAYQTGVWVPMVVAGPLVEQPGRAVTSMVNVADLYQLFGEIAGINVASASPHVIDAMPMLPYLRNPQQPPVRKWNFTQVGINDQANGALNGPCQISSTCTQIPVTKSVCEDNGGIWWGTGATDPATAGIPAGGFTYCCDVNVWQKNHNQPTYTLQPLDSSAVRNERYKIVSNYFQWYDSDSNTCAPKTTVEFYEINQAVPKPLLDENDLVANGQPPLSPEQQQNYDELYAQLAAILGSQPPCPGDGNIDGVVNAYDLYDWAQYAYGNSGRSSWFDIDMDGYTNDRDRQLIAGALGTRCPAPGVAARGAAFSPAR